MNDVTDRRMRPPFEPQPLAAMRARYPFAVAEAIELTSEPLYLAGADRRHVFDFHDGLRLVVSRERPGRGGEVVHLSGSAAPGSSLYASCERLARGRSARAAMKSFLARTLEGFVAVSGRPGPFEVVESCVSDGGTPHLWITPPRKE